MAGDVTMALEFYVETAPGMYEQAAGITLINTNFAFTALINNMDISLSIAKVNVDAIGIDYCNFGTLRAVTLRLELNNGFRVLLPVINKILSTHSIKFPSHIGPLFELSNLTLGYYDDYIYAGATPTFVAPKTLATKDSELEYPNFTAFLN